MPFFSTIFSAMREIRTGPYINNLRYCFLPNDSENEY